MLQDIAVKVASANIASANGAKRMSNSTCDESSYPYTGTLGTCSPCSKTAAGYVYKYALDLQASQFSHGSNDEAFFFYSVSLWSPNLSLWSSAVSENSWN